jgi:type VII secretion protein EssB
MKVYNGQDTLEIERDGQQFNVFLEGSQVKTKDFKAFETEAKIIDKPNDQYALELDITLPEDAKSLAESVQLLKTREERLQFAQKLSLLKFQRDNFRLPFLHPETIFLSEESFFVAYFGLLDKLAPLSLEEDLFLRQYKALVISSVNPKLSFEENVDGSSSAKDKFSVQIGECATLEEVESCLAQEFIKEHESANKGKVYVSKGRHHFLMAFSILAVLALGAAGYFIVNAYTQTVPKQNAIISAQSDFLTQNYNQAISDLDKYQASELPNSAKYVLAVSSVELSSLTMTQKQAVLNNLSIKTDDNTLDYWIDTGRGNFNGALNLAKNLGDNTLTYLAYYNLYEETKLNTTMSGAKKQQLLDEYSKEITSLGKTLGLNQ